MEYFVDRTSVVRQIWGKGDTILFIFAGASAEFALNKAVDWLYFTGRLPADPLGRLFTTVQYARSIVFAERNIAEQSIDKITAIHKDVENARGAVIPDWAYRDVLFMLIYYSIAAFELLERKLTDEEKEEVFNVFFRVGSRMGLKALPLSYNEWMPKREEHLQQDLKRSDYTIDLCRQYRKHLGPVRYQLLKEGQMLVVPQRVRALLGLRGFSLFTPVIPLYKISRKLKLDWLLKSLILPTKYKDQIKDLDITPLR
ncbi:MAG: DUF2236 domain-containing protein [Flavisolibacter sp.]|nr:DUF2236 domain-containing protein [Flavisolibacter sp.]